jgi:arylsulfatase A-like enzyme
VRANTPTRRLRSALLLALPLLLTACDLRRGAPNLLVIVVDTLRADRLGAYGNTRRLTPFLDSLAARGTVFRHAYAQSSWTNPSVASLLTSRFQSQHGIIAFGSVLAAAETTLPEVLKEHGYATAAFTANGLLAERNGFAQGYDAYGAYLIRKVRDPDGKTRWQNESGERVTREALAWVEGRAATRPVKPAFLYLHYVEPHTPYDPSAAALARVFHGRARPDPDTVQKTYFRGVVEPLGADELRSVEDTYDAAVITLDDRLRELFAGLERTGFLDHAVVVVTADHGEEFKDHGFMGHGGTLYEEVIRVPLLVVGRRQRAAAVDDVVSLVDVAPTLLTIAGIPIPPSFAGRSLASLLAGDGRGDDAAPRQEPAYSELLTPENLVGARLCSHERAVVLGRHKLIQGMKGERELYDLASDPAERQARDPSGPDADGLLLALDGLRERARVRDGATASALDPKAQEELDERLRALGYVR